ncbi:hypothetical protein [Congregibacter sp.]|uniref:hypothetical protein n=1 Tax=Congregibacter sp. TaxID=2744308 RepID=UPI003F6AAA09
MLLITSLKVYSVVLLIWAGAAECFWERQSPWKAIAEPVMEGLPLFLGMTSFSVSQKHSAALAEIAMPPIGAANDQNLVSAEFFT